MDSVDLANTETRIPTSRTLSLDALRSFVAICETGSFRQAALRVHRSPSAVSLQIGKLEKQLSTTLLNRDARHVEITQQGEVLLGQARRLLGLNDETFAAFYQSPLAGQLCLCAPHDLGVSLVPGLLRQLADVHPAVQVDVRLGTSTMVRESISNGSANLALFNEVGPPAIPARDLFSEPLQWLMARGGRMTEQTTLRLAVANIGCAWRDAALGALQAANKDYQIAYSSDTSTGQIAAIRADLAIAALPQGLADRDLVEVPPTYGLPPLPQTHVRLADDGSDLAKAIVELVVADIASRNSLKGAPSAAA